MRLIVSFDASSFAGFAKRITKRIEEEVHRAMYDIGGKIQQDIISGRARVANTSTAFNPGGYDLNDSGALMQGVRTALHVAKDQVGFLTKKMDEATLTSAGIGYWRLFEYGGRSRAYPRAGSRAGGSQDYAFVPQLGQGKIGEGTMHFTNQEDAMHPGVMPVRMFQDAFLQNRKYIRERMKQALKNAARKK